MIGTKNWLELFASVKEEARAKGHRPTLQIRWVEDEKMVAFLRGMLIDESLWIMNIHRPGLDRGIDGIVYHGFCIEKSTNLFTVLDYYWNAVWKDSINPNPTLRERLQRALNTYRNTVKGLGIGLFSIPFLIVWKQETVAYGLLGAAVTKIAEDWLNYIADLGRLLEKIGQSLQDISRKRRNQ